MGNNDLLFTEILEVEYFFLKGKLLKQLSIIYTND